jgi:hypothetical protein
MQKINLFNYYLICYRRYLNTVYCSHIIRTRRGETNAYKNLEKTKEDHVGCGDTDCRIILKWIRTTGSGDATGLNSLNLWASLVTFCTYECVKRPRRRPV